MNMMRPAMLVELRWAARRWILNHFGLPIRTIDRAVSDGCVHSIKFGETRQAARFFFVKGCERYRLELAAGREPRRVAGRLQ